MIEINGVEGMKALLDTMKGKHGGDSPHEIYPLKGEGREGWTLHRFYNRKGIPFSALYNPEGEEVYSTPSEKEHNMLIYWEIHGNK